jgi:hypothetical protein
MATKKTKSHTSTRKKALASRRTKETASKASKLSAKSKKSKKTNERPAWLKKRDELTLKMWGMIYEDYRKGKFIPLF